MQSLVYSDTRIILLEPEISPANFAELGELAITHHMTMNDGYVARKNTDKKKDEIVYDNQRLSESKTDPATIYVTTDAQKARKLAPVVEATGGRSVTYKNLHLLDFGD